MGGKPCVVMFYLIMVLLLLEENNMWHFQAMIIATESPTPQPQPTGNFPMYGATPGSLHPQGHNARRDARKRRTRSRACSSAKNAAPSACAYPQEPTATSSFALATIIGRPREEDPNALEQPFSLFHVENRLLSSIQDFTSYDCRGISANEYALQRKTTLMPKLPEAALQLASAGYSVEHPS
ncbi:hypothetical protein C3L33_12184, partial [Rhododendron williamsianum]